MLVDTGGAFGVKYATFALVVLYVGIRSLRQEVSIPWSVILLEGTLFFLLPLCFLIASLTVFGVPATDALQHLSPFPVLLVLPLMLEMESRDTVVATFSKWMMVGALVTVFMFGLLIFLFLTHRLGLISAINKFTDTHRLGFFGARPQGNGLYTFFPNVEFRWYLLLLPAAVLSFHRRRDFQFAALSFGILATISTGAILALALGIGWVVLELGVQPGVGRLYLRRAAIALVVLLIIAGGLVYFGKGDILLFAVSKLSGTSHSTSIKLGHIRSILDLLSQSPWYVLFGTGVGSSFYSEGTHTVVQYVEVSHFELVRQFGIIYASAFVLYCYGLFLKVRRTDITGKVLGISLACLFLAAGTNPLLISPVFFFVLAMTRAYVTLYARSTAAAGAVQLPSSARGLSTAAVPPLPEV